MPCKSTTPAEIQSRQDTEHTRRPRCACRQHTARSRCRTRAPSHRYRRMRRRLCYRQAIQIQRDRLCTTRSLVRMCRSCTLRIEWSRRSLPSSPLHTRICCCRGARTNARDTPHTQPARVRSCVCLRDTRCMRVQRQSIRICTHTRIYPQRTPCCWQYMVCRHRPRQRLCMSLRCIVRSQSPLCLQARTNRLCTCIQYYQRWIVRQHYTASNWLPRAGHAMWSISRHHTPCTRSLLQSTSTFRLHTTRNPFGVTYLFPADKCPRHMEYTSQRLLLLRTCRSNTECTSSLPWHRSSVGICLSHNMYNSRWTVHQYPQSIVPLDNSDTVPRLVTHARSRSRSQTPNCTAKGAGRWRILYSYRSNICPRHI